MPNHAASSDLCPAHGVHTAIGCPGCTDDVRLMDYDHGHELTKFDKHTATLMMAAIFGWVGSGLDFLADMPPQDVLHAAELIPECLPGKVDGTAPLAYLVVLAAKALRMERNADLATREALARLRASCPGRSVPSPVAADEELDWDKAFRVAPEAETAGVA